MNYLMFIGFALEVIFFVTSGLFLGLGNVLSSIISFLIAISLAIFTGIQIKKEGIEEERKRNGN